MPSHLPGSHPEKPLQLYDIAGCPFCRRVREAMSALELDVQVFPCRRGGTRFRPRVVALGGKAQFPYLVDPNTGVRMYESADIVAYLAATYGDGTLPPPSGHGAVRLLTGVAARLRRRHPARGDPGAAPVAAGRGPVVELELYGFEKSAECGVVRDMLCSLEIPYLLHNVLEGSRRWRELAQRSGTEGVPFLVDPGAGAEKRGAAEIADYLEHAYGDG